MTTKTSSDYTPGAAPNVATLRSRISGEIIGLGDPGYDEARSGNNLDAGGFPWLIVRARTASDVVEAVRFARAQRLPLAVKSGGHSIPGYSRPNGALVVDLSRMKSVTIDAEKGTARVQPGATSADVMGPAHAYGLALSTGDTATVGIAGLTLGGGIGYMVRKYGLAIDNLLSVEMVTADGKLIKASREQHSELFWALRGGGGNFGIVTQFEFQMARVGAIYGGALVLPARPEIIRAYFDYAVQAPDELTTIAHVMHLPPAPFVPEERIGELAFVIFACWAGDLVEGERAIAPIRALAEPIADTVGPIPYPVIYDYMELASHPHYAAVRSFFGDEFPSHTIEGIIDAVNKAPSPMSMVQFRPLGGAFGRVAPGETAFAHRGAQVMVAVLGLWLDPEADPVVQRGWADDTFAALRDVANGVYSNFLMDEGEARVREAYPDATYSRLAAVKAQYDPENVFRFNQNIRPAR